MDQHDTTDTPKNPTKAQTAVNAPPMPNAQSQADGHAETKDETKAPQPVGSER